MATVGCVTLCLIPLLGLERWVPASDGALGADDFDEVDLVGPVLEVVPVDVAEPGKVVLLRVEPEGPDPLDPPSAYFVPYFLPYFDSYFDSYLGPSLGSSFAGCLFEYLDPAMDLVPADP